MSDGQIGAVNGTLSVWSSILRRPGRSGIPTLARHRRVRRAGPTRLPDSWRERLRFRCHILVASRHEFEASPHRPSLNRDRLITTYPEGPLLWVRQHRVAQRQPVDLQNPSRLGAEAMTTSSNESCSDVRAPVRSSIQPGCNSRFRPAGTMTYSVPSTIFAGSGMCRTRD
jgi:hypothetical protein